MLSILRRNKTQTCDHLKYLAKLYHSQTDLISEAYASMLSIKMPWLITIPLSSDYYDNSGPDLCALLAVASTYEIYAKNLYEIIPKKKIKYDFGIKHILVEFDQTDWHLLMLIARGNELVNLPGLRNKYKQTTA